MIIPIVGASALEFWLSGVSAFPANQFSAQNRKLVSLPEEYDIPYSQELYRKLAKQYGFSQPIVVMANKETGKKIKDSFCAVKRSAKIPEKSFIQLTDKILISSPELCFIQLSKVFPVSKLVEAANALCAAYSLDESATFAQIKREPITSTKNIKSLIKSANGMSGIKKARQAISYAVDRSFSPMESKLAAVASLPLILGGYGLSKPELNADVVLSDDAAKLLGRQTCCCDLVWEKQGVIVEYDSNLTHLSVNQHTYDKRKATALNMSGYKVFYITAANMHNFRDIETTFLNLRKFMGLRSSKDSLHKYESIRNEAVRAIVFDSWRKYYIKN